jgi:hypothetical protein
MKRISADAGWMKGLSDHLHSIQVIQSFQSGYNSFSPDDLDGHPNFNNPQDRISSLNDSLTAKAQSYDNPIYGIFKLVKKF